ncbi:DUF357 domain-containing protein [Candidatus Woesearchaeota archaeon]|nr:DUF357 domain-containing protein [Candidatus Woesearchaeota archaeon]
MNKTNHQTNLIKEEKLTKYFDITGRALKKVKIGKENAKEKLDWKAAAADFLDMAQRYYDDAEHFKKKGEIVNAFAALNYAHGWLDAGARLGLFDVDGDNVLFTVDAKNEVK